MPRPLRLTADDGQSTLEWTGVAAVVVAVVVALLAVAPGGTTIGDAWTCLVSRVTGQPGGCGTDVSRAAGAPDFPCVVVSSGAAVRGGVRVLVLDLEAGDAYVREELSDGTIRVTFIEEGSAGASAQVGGGVSGEVGEVGGGGAARGEAGASLGGEAAVTRIFTDPGQADQFIRDRIGDEAVDALPLPVQLPVSAVRGIIDAITGHETPQGEDGGTAVTVEGGVHVRGEGAAGSAQVEGEATAAAGAIVTSQPDGSTEIAIRVEGALEGSGSAGPVAGAVGGGGSGQVTVVLDPAGAPSAVRLTLDAESAASAGLGGDIGEQIPGLDQIQQGGGLTGTVEVELDLTDPALGEARDVLVGIARDAVGGRASPAALGDAIAAALGDLETGSTVTAVLRRTSDDGVSGQVDINAGAGVGVEGEVVRDDAQLISAHYWDPVLGRFVPWVSCIG